MTRLNMLAVRSCGGLLPQQRLQKRRFRSSLSVSAAASQKNVLVVGGGGREHALCWKLSQSSRCGMLYCAPGNAGIFSEPDVRPAPISDVNQHQEFCEKSEVDLVVIGPEGPLVAGLADDLAAAGILTFGPSRAAAQLEGSKSFMKGLCKKYGIPTGSYACFTDAGSAKEYIQEKSAPIVVKADGLAAGKGAIVCKTVEEAQAAVDRILVQKTFGAAGASIIVEEFLEGEEASYFAFIDGETVLPLTSAQDHKAVGEGDVGENTGGMGAYSPAPVVTPAMEHTIISDILQPTAKGMVEVGIPFKGVLFAGLMIQQDKVDLLEYNVRFGDPECQSLMMRMESDLLDLMIKSCEGELKSVPPIQWSSKWALTVVMAAQGYPGSYQKGTSIRNLDAIQQAKVFHAGTALGSQGQLISNGGRVLGITSLGSSVIQAQKTAYEAVDLVDWPEGFCRRDIGWRAVTRERPNVEPV